MRSTRKRFTALSLATMLLAWSGAVLAQDSGQLAVSYHELGRGLEDRQVQEPTDRFAEGEQAVFLTRVTGGSKGDRIRHVWIHDGKEVSVGLSLGGPSWRTWSVKKMYPGARGDWAVEARDVEGNVLARREFACEAAETAGG
jgi:hypothetical protein